MEFSKNGKPRIVLCPVCTDFGTGHNDKDKGTTMKVNNGVLKVTGGCNAVEIAVKYCPLCGRDLK